MDELKKILTGQIGLNEEYFERFMTACRTFHLRKKEYLIKENQTCKFIGFVKRGLQRAYVNKNDSEFNLAFYLPGMFISAYTSFITQSPTHGNVQALNDSEIIYISYEEYSLLLEESPEWYKLGKYIAEYFFIRKCRREASLLMDSAAERYKALIEMYPGIEQSVPQYHIASYLGIKPESLSRLKSLTYVNEI